MILITEFMDESQVERMAAVHPTTYAPQLADDQSRIPAMLPGVEALIVRNRTQVGSAVLDAAQNLKVVGRLGVGLDNIDLDLCKEKSVEVIPAIGANTLSVAEYVVTNALILLRNAYQVNDRMISGEWPRTDCSGKEASGRRLGLIGFGGIAQETSRLASGIGMAVAAFDPFLPEGHPAWNGVSRMELDQLIATSDAISLHVPLTTATRHLINAETLSQMKSGAVLINAARGGVVDDEALAGALRRGHIGGAALDVFETEPLTAEAALMFKGLGNLVLTPHIAGVTQDSNGRVSEMIANLVLQRLSEGHRHP